jgi:hypothetical protein
VTKRDRITLCVLAAVAVIAAGWMLAIKPKREEAATLADQAAQAQQRRDAALASLANAKQARADFAEAQIGIARLGKAVPGDEDVATLVFQLERSARSAGIDFRKVALSQNGASQTPAGGAGTDQPQGSDVEKVPFTLTFEGDFFSLRKFIDHAHSFTRMRDGKYVSVRGRLLSIEGVGLVAAEDGFPRLKAQIAAVAYKAPAPKLPTAGGDTAADTGAAGATTASAGATSASSATPASTTTSTEVAR